MCQAGKDLSQDCGAACSFNKIFWVDSVNKDRVFLSDKAEIAIIAEMLVQFSCDCLFILIDTVASRILD